jgi:MFS family permease
MTTATTASNVTKVSAFAVPLLGLFAAIQSSAPNVASTMLVGASKSLGMTGSTQALAASMQTLAIAATVITTGLMADRLGRRNVLMGALLVGAAGTIVVSIAAATWMYFLGMAIVGIGLGAVYGASFAYLKAVVAPDKLAGALGVFTAVLMVATLILTFVGGALTSINWRVAFLIFPVVNVIGFFLVPLILPKQPRVKGGSLDVLGQLLLAIGVVSFLYGVSQLAKSLTAPGTLIPIILGVVLLVAFAVWESKYPGHFFPMELFRSPVFLAAICFGFLLNFGNSVAFLQATNLWQYVNGLKTSEVSVWQLPLMLAGIVAGLVTGRMMAKGMTNRTAGFIGGAMATVGFVFLALLHSSKGLLGFVPGLVLVGGGVVVASVPFGNLILREAPAKFLGPVSSSRTTFGQFFYSLGFALSTVMIDKMTDGGIVKRLTEAGVQPNQISTGLDAVNAYASSGTAPSTSVGQQALTDAVTSYGGAFRNTMLIVAVALALMTLLSSFLLRKGEGEPQPVHNHDNPPPAADAA